MRVVDLRAPLAARHFISRNEPLPTLGSPERPPGARRRRRALGGAVRVDLPPRRHSAATRGRSGRTATHAATSARSPPTRGSLRALAGNKVHLCQRPARVRVRRRTLAGRSVRSPPGRPSYPSTPGGAARTRTGSSRNAALRPPPPPPWPVDFAFPGLSKAGSGPEEARPRDCGLWLRPGRLRFARCPSQPRAPSLPRPRPPWLGVRVPGPVSDSGGRAPVWPPRGASGGELQVPAGPAQ